MKIKCISTHKSQFKKGRIYDYDSIASWYREQVFYWMDDGTISFIRPNEYDESASFIQVIEHETD